eukprot:gene17185-biopygen4895
MKGSAGSAASIQLDSSREHSPRDMSYQKTYTIMKLVLFPARPAAPNPPTHFQDHTQAKIGICPFAGPPWICSMIGVRVQNRFARRLQLIPETPSHGKSTDHWKSNGEEERPYMKGERLELPAPFDDIRNFVEEMVNGKPQHVANVIFLEGFVHSMELDAVQEHAIPESFL